MLFHSTEKNCVKNEKLKKHSVLYLDIYLYVGYFSFKIVFNIDVLRFAGVEEVRADSESGRVVVKGKAVDPEKVCERLHKKSGRKVELISPIFKLPMETNVKDEEDKKQPREDKEEEVIKSNYLIFDCAHPSLYV